MRQPPAMLDGRSLAGRSRRGDRRRPVRAWRRSCRHSRLRWPGELAQQRKHCRPGSSCSPPMDPLLLLPHRRLCCRSSSSRRPARLLRWPLSPMTLAPLSRSAGCPGQSRMRMGWTSVASRTRMRKKGIDLLGSCCSTASCEWCGLKRQGHGGFAITSRSSQRPGAGGQQPKPSLSLASTYRQHRLHTACRTAQHSREI